MSYVQYGRLLEIHVYMRTTFFDVFTRCNEAAPITFLPALRTGLARNVIHKDQLKGKHTYRV